MERWKPIPKYPRYEVSDRGRVRRATDGRRLKKGQTLKPGLCNGGYPCVVLSNGAKTRRTYRVHSLVMMAFVGHRRRGQTTNHKDGNKENNHLSNLEYCTRSENVQHGIRVLAEGTSGTAHGLGKLTPKSVRRIRALAKKGIGQRELGRRFGVTHTTIHAILNGRTWTHVA